MMRKLYARVVSIKIGLKMETKRCSGYVKHHGLLPHDHPITDFHKDKSQRDGLAIRCKPCQQIVNAKNNRKHNPRTSKMSKYKDVVKKAAQRTQSQNKSIEDNNLGFYVYYHYNGNEVVYVGKGRGDRAWSFGRSQANHLIWLIDQAKSGNQWVTLRKYNLTEEEAEWLEAVKINLYKPRFNVQIPSLKNLRKKYDK